MGDRSRHTVTLDDDLWSWLEKMEEKSGMNKSEILDRAGKVYAGKMASGEWKDPKLQDKYERQIESLSEDV